MMAEMLNEAIHRESLDERLTRLIESSPEAIADPFPLYRELRREVPVYQWGPTVVVSGFDEVKRIARDAITFSNRAYSVGSRAQSIRSRLSGSELEAFDDVAAFESMYISRSDGGQHARLREIAHRAFSPRKMAQLGTLVEEFTEELLDRMVDGERADFVEAVSSRLPVLMINSLLDVPFDDVGLIKGWTGRIGKNRGGAVIDDLMDAHAALAEFRAYVAEIVEHHRRTPGSTDLVSALMGANESERLSNDELLATMVVLLFGGSDTTQALLSNGLHGLLTHSDQWDRLCDDPDAVVQRAVEELARWVSPVQTTWRVTTMPTRIGDLRVGAGQTILLLIGAANRDPAHFLGPDRLDVERSPNHHIAFFFGPHFCLGASLARLEAITVFGMLARRLPGLQLVGDRDEPAWKGNVQFRARAYLDLDLAGVGAQ